VALVFTPPEKNRILSVLVLIERRIGKWNRLNARRPWPAKYSPVSPWAFFVCLGLDWELSLKRGRKRRRGRESRKRDFHHASQGRRYRGWGRVAVIKRVCRVVADGEFNLGTSSPFRARRHLGVLLFFSFTRPCFALGLWGRPAPPWAPKNFKFCRSVPPIAGGGLIKQYSESKLFQKKSFYRIPDLHLGPYSDFFRPTGNCGS